VREGLSSFLILCPKALDFFLLIYRFSAYQQGQSLNTYSSSSNSTSPSSLSASSLSSRSRLPG
jgi:hypothetical protein